MKCFLSIMEEVKCDNASVTPINKKNCSTLRRTYEMVNNAAARCCTVVQLIQFRLGLWPTNKKHHSTTSPAQRGSQPPLLIETILTSGRRPPPGQVPRRCSLLLRRNVTKEEHNQYRHKKNRTALMEPQEPNFTLCFLFLLLCVVSGRRLSNNKKMNWLLFEARRCPIVRHS